MKFRNLREIVSTLLDSRGCVALQWEKTGIESYPLVVGLQYPLEMRDGLVINNL